MLAWAHESGHGLNIFCALPTQTHCIL